MSDAVRAGKALNNDSLPADLQEHNSGQCQWSLALSVPEYYDTDKIDLQALEDLCLVRRNVDGASDVGLGRLPSKASGVIFLGVTGQQDDVREGLNV